MSDGGWQPREGARVRIVPREHAPPDEAPPPEGVWMCLSRAPSGPTHWWCLAVDTDSKLWCAHHPREHISHCIDMPNRRLAPVNTVRI